MLREAKSSLDLTLQRPNELVQPALKIRLYPERQQDRADDHHAFDEDAEPGDLGLRKGGQHVVGPPSLLPAQRSPSCVP